MAKKVQGARQTRPTSAAARRTQPALVRTDPPLDATHANGTGNGATTASATALITAPVAKRVAPSLDTTRTKAKTTPTPSNSARTAAAFQDGKARVKAAAQPMLRRSSIRAENYSYVVKDLRLIAVVAVIMFAFMIVLHFVLPS